MLDTVQATAQCDLAVASPAAVLMDVAGRPWRRHGVSDHLVQFHEQLLRSGCDDVPGIGRYQPPLRR